MVVERAPGKPLQPIRANEQPTAEPEDHGAGKASEQASEVAPRPPPSFANRASHQPAFGQTSMPQSPLARKMPQADANKPQSSNDHSNLFYQPKKRPEHHRGDVPRHPHIQGVKEFAKDRLNPFVAKPAATYKNDPRYAAPNGAAVSISKPADVEFITSRPAPQTTYGSTGRVYGGAQPVHIDLTKDEFSMFRPTAEAYTYVDPTKATEDLKALLEGAIEDKDDLPRTRQGRKQMVENLAEKLKGMKVGADETAEVPEEEEEDDGSVEGIQVKLLPHQVDGLAWMKDRELGTGKKGTVPKGGILADDMGLGKTLQSISLIISNPPRSASDTEEPKRTFSTDMGKGTLVVAPLALIRQWELEIREKVASTHALRVCVHHGPQRTKRFEDLKKYDVVITTYQILVSEHGNSSSDPKGLQVGCFGVHWYRVVLDEAHTIKNRNAKMTQACYALRSQYRWCLTGTPMQNNLEELQSLVRFLRIKPYNDLQLWKRQIEAPIKEGRGEVAIQRLQHFLKIFMKRRTKDILKRDGALNPGGKPSDGVSSTGFKVTERKVKTVKLDFSPDERQFYDRLQSRAEQTLANMMSGNQMSYASALVLLLRLRQSCDHVELVAKKIGKDIGALDNESPRKNTKAADDEMDEIAGMFGGLGVTAKNCETCGAKLEPTKDDATHCEECREDLASMRKSHGRKKSVKTEKSKPQRKPRNRNIITDSDDEDEGEWLVDETKRGPTKLGRAGGSDDEDAEGGGHWLNTDGEDSDSSLPPPSKLIASKRVQPDSDSESGSEDSGVEDTFHSASEGEDEDVFTSSRETTNIGSSTKIKHMLRLLHREVKDHKFIVFSQFTSMLDLIEPFLQRDGIKFARYDGGMRNDMREASLNRLRNEPGCRLLLCSLKCGSLGLNLTAATRVIILEPFWNPFVEEQAIDRVHRLTQKIDVVVYRLIIADSVEDRILALQERKRELAAQAIDGSAKQNATKLGMREILQLFRQDLSDRFNAHSASPKKSEPTRLLSGAGADAASMRSSSTSSAVSAPRSRHTSPPLSGREREDAVYGRRW